jgi:hydroxymethylpyrimidine/phosphomethylpyrimidine kinase
MNPDSAGTPATEIPEGLGAEPAPPAALMCFNVSEPSGAGGLAGDVATAAAMGAHALPITCGIVMRDTADIFDLHDLEGDIVAEQARSILEDVTISGWKVGFLGSADNVSAVAEILSDYTEIPLVAHVPNLSWMDEDKRDPYLDAFRELILPATEVLVGNHKTLQDFLLPEWDSERPPSARELAVAAADHGTRYVLVTGIALVPKAVAKGSAAPGEAFIDNVLASPQGAIAGEKFERFDTSFVGAGDTLSAALAALLATGAELQAAVAEALNFLDQSLDAGFRPGMGHVVPDRFFWALPPPDGEEGDAGDGPDEPEPEAPPPKAQPRRVH